MGIYQHVYERGDNAGCCVAVPFGRVGDIQMAEGEMKLAVVGSRNWQMPIVISQILSEIYPSEIVSGGAQGVDSFAEAWAKLHLIPVKVFKPDWSKGKSAGAQRNRQIIDYCDKLIAFWDGKSKGTKISIDMAAKAGKLWKVYHE